MMTGKMTSLARPYAIAAFEFASDKKAISAWEIFLDAAALVSNDAAVQGLLRNPRVTSAQIIDLYCRVLAQYMNQEMTNFIHLLTQNHRLNTLPGIAELFRAYRLEQEKTLTVKVVSAIDLDQKYQQKLIAALTKRLQRQISLECRTDPKLLGGAVITAGDTVIDGSVQSKLNRMLEFISGTILR